MEQGQGVLPIAFIYQMVPVRDDVVNRATVVTIGNAAIHAAARLRLQGCIIWLQAKFAVIVQALLRIEIIALAPVEFEEACILAHVLASRILILLQPKRLLHARLRVGAARVRSRVASP